MPIHDCDALNAEIQEALRRSGASTLEQAQVVLADVMRRRNTAPQADFCGLSSEAMHRFLHFPYDSPDLVVSPTVLTTLPSDSRITLLFELLAAAIGDDGVKATATGNLPRAMVHAIAAGSATSDELAELMRFSSLQSEANFRDLHITREVAQLSGLIRKVKGRFVLTKTCRSLLGRSGMREIFPRLMCAHATKFNWAYLTRYDDIEFVHQAFVYTLYLLERFGDDWRPTHFYADAFLKAFPKVLRDIEDTSYSTAEERFRNQYTWICLNRFCLFLGLVEAKSEGPGYLRKVVAVRKSGLLHESVRFQNAATLNSANEPKLDKPY